MFSLQKNSSTEENENNFLNLNQKKDFNIKEMPIHTMREDLENIKKNQATHGMISMPPQEKKMPASYEDFSQKQKTSPFLNFDSDENLLQAGATANEKPQIMKMGGISAKTGYNKETDLTFSPAKEIKDVNEKTPFLTKNSAIFNTNTSGRLISVYAVSLVLIAIIVLIGYYLPKNEMDLSSLLKNPLSSEPSPKLSPEPTAPSIPTEPPVEAPAVEEPTPSYSYSQANPNYLKLEDVGLDPKTILQQHIQKVSQEGYTAPVEFVLTNQQNAPLSFADFAGKIGLKLSQQVMENLGSNFSLFIYNDISVSRIGLSVDLSMESRNSGKLATALLQEEKTLADEISPLFFTTDYKVGDAFRNSEYAGIRVRFQNIISPDNLSVDYAVDKNKLLIGTTKLTLRAVIDHINNTAPQE